MRPRRVALICYGCGMSRPLSFAAKFLLCLGGSITVDMIWDLTGFWALVGRDWFWWEPLVIAGYWIGSALFYATVFHYMFRPSRPPEDFDFDDD